MSRKGENIRKRKDGRYEGRYITGRDENGRAQYASVYGHSLSETRELLKAAKEENAGEDFLTNRKFSDVAELWLNRDDRSIAQTTRDRYETTLELYVLPYIKDKICKDISDVELNRLLKQVSEDGEGRGKDGGNLKGKTLIMIRDLVNQVLSYAKEMDFPEEKFEIPKSESDPYPALTIQELEAVCRCAKYNHTPEMLGMLMMIFMGIRVGEVCALSCDDVHLSSMEVFIHQSVHRVKSTNAESENKTENLITELPWKNQIRMETIPEPMLEFVEEFYIPGTILLTGEKNVPMEAKTLKNRIDRTFELYRIGKIPFQRYHKTYAEGKADLGILKDAFSGKKRETPYDDTLDVTWLKEELRADLKALRMLIGMTADDMGNYIGVSSPTYMKIEDGRRDISWDEFLALVFLFRYNTKTEGVVESLGLYPKALQKKLEVSNS